MKCPVKAGSPSERDESQLNAVGSKVEASPLLEEESFTTADPVEADSWFVVLCVALVATGPFSFGYSLGYTSPAIAKLKEDLGLSKYEASLFGALVNVGAMVGGIISGKVADRLGRKGAFIVAAVPGGIGWLSVATAESIVPLCFGRLLMGFATGVVSLAVPVYIAEVSPGRLRGGLGAVNQLGITVGIMTVYLLGIGLNWRILAGVGIIPLVLLLVAVLIVPESPRWLAMNAGPEHATQALKKLRGQNVDVGRELRDIREAADTVQLQPEARFADLLSPNLARPLLVGVGLMVLQQFSGVNAVMFYSGEIFKTAGITSSDLAAFFVGLLQVVMTCVAAWLIDRAGRRPLLIASAIGMALSSAALGYSFHLKRLVTAETNASEVAGTVAIVSVLIYVASFSLGVGAIPWIIMSEIFPVHIRGLAASIAVVVNWSCSFFVTQTFQALCDFSSTGAFWLYGAVCAFTAAFAYKYVPETRGKTLEEIEASFKTL